MLERSGSGCGRRRRRGDAGASPRARPSGPPRPPRRTVPRATRRARRRRGRRRAPRTRRARRRAWSPGGRVVRCASRRGTGRSAPGPAAPSASARRMASRTCDADLALAEHHRVEPGRDREQVLGGVVLPVRDSGLGELVELHPARLGEQALQRQEPRVVVRDLPVDLDPVAGGQDRPSRRRPRARRRARRPSRGRRRRTRAVRAARSARDGTRHRVRGSPWKCGYGSRRWPPVVPVTWGSASAPGRPGPRNAITDVAGVRVGHRTVVRGDDGAPDAVRTGVTAVFPHGDDPWAGPRLRRDPHPQRLRRADRRERDPGVGDPREPGRPDLVAADREGLRRHRAVDRGRATRSRGRT